MAYFNYHARAKNLIKTDHCFAVSIFKNYHNIKPALVLYFDNHSHMPIRDYMWEDYILILKEKNLSINNPDNIDLSKFPSVD